MRRRRRHAAAQASADSRRAPIDRRGQRGDAPVALQVGAHQLRRAIGAFGSQFGAIGLLERAPPDCICRRLVVEQRQRVAQHRHRRLDAGACDGFGDLRIARPHQPALLREPRPQRDIVRVARHARLELRERDHRIFAAQGRAAMLRLQIEHVRRQDAVGERGERPAIGRPVVIDQQVEVEQRVRQQALRPAQAGAVEQNGQRRPRMARAHRVSHRLHRRRDRLRLFLRDEVGQLRARIRHGAP